MSDSNTLALLIRDFEQAWREERPIYVNDFLSSYSNCEITTQVLIELICVDLELRWKARAQDKSVDTWFLSDYVDHCKELGSITNLPLELIEEEYRVRALWGDQPSHIVFAQRFTTRSDEILRSLARVDREIATDLDGPGQSKSHTAIYRHGMKTPAMDLRTPLNYGDYLLSQMIGAGMMGKVYRATHISSERVVAVKFLKKHFLINPAAVQRFVREAHLVAGLKHSGVVQTHGLGTTPGGGYFIVMDLITGPDLASRMAQKSVPPRTAVEWIMQACDALEYVHAAGVIHCDLKPANLILDASNNLRVTDFGLARVASDSESLMGRIEGTAAYMAPEQISSWWGPISNQTDVYGIGAVLYELLTGHSPFEGATLPDILAQVVAGVAVVSPGEVRPELPPALVNICARCLEKHPRERYETLRQVQSSLHDCLATL